ncbi:heavy metal-binding domain-containing protein [Telluribacter sp.]|uniref:heavy metal-binding domain-containing protein n=1 Tax=Telluribacter sp. TaxID=1978767 RepID=UPI002E13CC07|nr:heavy metal-binding domain-containing protein [Telluribacter sp.]
MKKLLFLLSFSTLVACNGGNKSTVTQAVEEPVNKEVADTRQYACPMKCEGDKTYAEAGQCPVCKMDLKEVVVADMHSDSTGHAAGHEGHNH